MEDGSVKRLQRYLSIILCIALCATGSIAFSEEDVTVDPTQTQEEKASPTPEPTEEEPSAAASSDEEPPAPEPTEEEPPAAASSDEESPTPEPTEEESPAAASSEEDPSVATPTPTAEETPVATPTVEVTPTPAPSISFKEDHLTYKRTEITDAFDYVGEFELEIENASDETLVWSTDDEEIAAFVALDKRTGEEATSETKNEDIVLVFRAYQAGTVHVQAALKADETINDAFTLTLEAPVYVVQMNETEISLDVGTDAQLSATLFEDGSPVEEALFTWGSDAEAVATVDGTGRVLSLAKGDANITATVIYEGKTYEESCHVTVLVPLVGISVGSVTFYSDETSALVVTPEPDNAEFDSNNLSYEVEAEYAPYISISSEGTVIAVTHDGLLETTDKYVDARVKVTYGEFVAYASVRVYQAATSVTIEEDTRVVWLGKTAALDVKIAPENCYDAVVSYASSDDACFTIDSTGLITGVGLGAETATVTMKSGRSFDFPVSVLQGTTSLRITVPTGNLRIGEKVQLSLARVPEDAVDEITWESSDVSLATIDPNGLVTLLLPGTVTITVSSESGETTSVGLKIIRPAAQIRIYNDIFSYFNGFILATGQAVSPFVDVLPSNATHTGYILSSSDESIARVSGGRIYGVSQGKATITITSEDGEIARTFRVKVVSKSKKIKSISVSRSSVTLKEGTKYKLRANINSGAKSKTVFWGSVDPSIAIVSQSGIVKAISPGVTYVYAMTYSGVYKRIKIKVKEQLPTKVRLNKSSISMYADKSYQLKATIYPSNVLQEENRVIEWKTTNKRVAVVSDEGMVYTISPGRAYIIARTVNGKTYRCRITVKKRYVKSVKIENPYGKLLLGGTYTLPVIVSPAKATNPNVKWSLARSSYKKYATINAKTGEIYCKKPGKIKVTATAKDGSRKRYTITLKIKEVPLTSFSVTRDGIEIGEDAQIELEYKSSFTAVATVDPVLYLEWSSSDARVASVKNGLVTATGAGTAKITVTGGGCYSYSFTVKVPRDENLPTYRALVVAQYQTSSAKGYLPFSKNTQKGVYDALGESVIGGARYEISYRSNLTSSSQLTSAIASTFADAKEGDVSVIYLLAHGTYKDGVYHWHLYGTGKTSASVPASTIISAMKKVKGNVVLVIPSCYSGGDENIPSTLTYMVRAADRDAAEGTSYSGIFASDGLSRASFFNTDESRSYDFFSYSMCKALGWNYMTDSAISLAADKDGDGYVTISELASTTKSLTAQTLEDYFDVYGSSAYFGPDSKSQNVTYYVSPDAASLAIFGK